VGEQGPWASGPREMLVGSRDVAAVQGRPGRHRLDEGTYDVVAQVPGPHHPERLLGQGLGLGPRLAFHGQDGPFGQGNRGSGRRPKVGADLDRVGQDRVGAVGLTGQQIRRSLQQQRGARHGLSGASRSKASSACSLIRSTPWRHMKARASASRAAAVLGSGTVAAANPSSAASARRSAAASSPTSMCNKAPEMATAGNGRSVPGPRTSRSSGGRCRRARRRRWTAPGGRRAGRPGRRLRRPGHDRLRSRPARWPHTTLPPVHAAGGPTRNSGWSRPRSRWW
jgi:hypothetical protein